MQTEHVTIAPEKPVARIVGGGERTKVVPLQYPVEYGGKVWTQITVSRMTAAQVDEFVSAAQRGESRPLPMTDAPLEVLDALDADDSAAVNDALNDFLPKLLRPAG